jgi:hypothetical protein
MISKLLEIEALEKYRLSVRFEDGTKVELDLSHLKGKGVFTLWDNYDNFRKVSIDKETGAAAWSREVEIDSTSLYLKVIGKTFDEWKKEQLTHASDK